jgi:fructuronate reductase
VSDVLRAQPLSRRALTSTGQELAAPPVRIAHLGLGAFHRAHQAWYTARAADAADWGIAAFSGHSADLADQLTAQGGVYSLIKRGPDVDEYELVGSIVCAIPGDDVAEFVRVLSDPAVVILTLTVTEAGYRLAGDGMPDSADPEVTADVELLRRGFSSQFSQDALRPSTALGRVLLGLEARRRIAAPVLAIVPCDNIPDNGGVVFRALAELAARISPELSQWLPIGVSMISTSVDRITPRVEAREAQVVFDATGWADLAPVVTEPFSDWVLSGDFPSGRPAWETAGARFVEEIEPWEARKLWMLNGAHTLLAAAGRLRGYATVAEAIDDVSCRADVMRLWDESARHLPKHELEEYREALIRRFENPRIEHRLDQIALGGLTKVRLRIVPVAQRELDAGRTAVGCAAAIGAWIASVLMGLAPAENGVAEALLAIDPVSELIVLVDERLAKNPTFRQEVQAAVRRHTSNSHRGATA